MSSHLTGFSRNGVHPSRAATGFACHQWAFVTRDGSLVMLGASNIRQQKRLWTLSAAPT